MSEHDLVGDVVRAVKAWIVIIIAIPLLHVGMFLLKVYQWYEQRSAPDCPVCGETMGHVAGVGYVCERAGCEAYGDTVERARARD